jgi:hypothetical protein
MVLFIKSKAGDKNMDGNIPVYIKNICKQMLNIEMNKSVYNVDGTFNKNPRPFNKYMYKQVEYNITPSSGTVLIYTSTVPNFQQREVLLNYMKHVLDSIPMEPQPGAVKLNRYNNYISSYYTLISNTPEGPVTTMTSDTTGKRYRHLEYCISRFSTPPRQNLVRFHWNIKVMHKPINTNRNISHLKVPEHSQYLGKEYLMRAISTIIYDDNDMFDVKSGIKQINYPSLNQYTAYKAKKIIDRPIMLSKTCGIDFELLSYYMPDRIN